jgi:hypothetical protein
VIDNLTFKFNHEDAKITKKEKKNEVFPLCSSSLSGQNLLSNFFYIPMRLNCELQTKGVFIKTQVMVYLDTPKIFINKRYHRYFKNPAGKNSILTQTIPLA